MNALLGDLGTNLNSGDCNDIHRMGKPPQQGYDDGPRPIILTFTKKTSKGIVYSNVKKLANMPQWKGLSVGDDLTLTQQNCTRDLRVVAANAKAKGHEVKLTNMGVSIDKHQYKHEDLDTLPHNLTLERIKTLRLDTAVVFQSKHSVLSNMYPARVKYDGFYYTSVEQGYQHQAALLSNAPSIASKVLCTDCPYEAKRLSKKLKVDPKWDEARQVKTLEALQMSKFSLNKTLRDYILDTGDLDLAEATKDLTFGTGLTLQEGRRNAEDNRPGRNLCGQSLVRVRTVLRVKYPLADIQQG